MSYTFHFLADCQLGAYATFSGVTESDLDRFAARGMKVEPVPKVEGFEWDARCYRTAIEAANSLRPEFVVMGGDMMDDLTSDSQREELLRITRLLDPEIPMYWVPGNHDLALDAEVPTSHTIEKYRETFGPDYYAFDWRDARFVVLNTVVIDHPEETQSELAEQLEWLEHELSQQSETARQVVLFGHHPLFLHSAGEEDSYWNLPLVRRKPILDLIHDHGVRWAFAGHWHRNSLARDGEFEMVTSGPVGYPLGDDPSGFRTVEVTSSGLRHQYHPLRAH